MLVLMYGKVESSGDLIICHYFDTVFKLNVTDSKATLDWSGQAICDNPVNREILALSLQLHGKAAENKIALVDTTIQEKAIKSGIHQFNPE